MHRIGDALRRAVVPALAVLTAFIVGAIVIVLTDVEHLQQIGTDPIAAIGGALGGVIDGYPALVSGAIGDPGRIVAAIQSGDPDDVARALRPISETLVSATPFIFAGLGLAVSFQAGLFNLGVDGQFVIGGLGAFITATLVAGSLPPPLVLVIAVAGGTVAGGAYGFVPGYLKARTGAHEVITTLMFNGLAPAVAFLMVQPFDLSGPSAAIPVVPRLIDLATIRVDYGFVVALAMAAVVSFVLFRTPVGFELRATGFSRTAAAGAGMRPDRITILAMSVSGGLVGMGSALFGLGPCRGLLRPADLRVRVCRDRACPARRPAARRRRGRGGALRRAHQRREGHDHRDRHPARAARRHRRPRHRVRRGARADPVDLAPQAASATDRHRRPLIRIHPDDAVDDRRGAKRCAVACHDGADARGAYPSLWDRAIEGPEVDLVLVRSATDPGVESVDRCNVVRRQGEVEDVEILRNA